MVFSIRAVLNEAWGLAKKNYGFLLAGLLVCLIIPILMGVYEFTVVFPQFQKAIVASNQSHLPPRIPPSFGWAFPIAFVAVIFHWFFAAGFFRSVLRIVRGEPPIWRDLLGDWGKFWKIAGTVALIYVGGIIGFYLLIVPSILFGLMASQALPAVVDSGLGPIAALKRSRALTRGCWGKLFLFFLALVILNGLGEICLLVGLLATVPVSVVAIALVYEKLRLRAASVEAPTPPAP